MANKIGLHTYIPVKNGFNGMLVYVSPKTGEEFIWESLGDENDMEFIELKTAKSSQKDFFINNWFLFDDPNVIEELGVSQYYNNALTYEEIIDIFDENTSILENKIKGLSRGQKESLAYRASQLVNEGKIDSVKTIKMLEKVLNINLSDNSQ